MIADRFGRYVPNVVVTFNGEVLNGPDSNTQTEVYESMEHMATFVNVTTAAKTLLEAMDTWR